jgi:competence protein ComEA
LDFSGNEKVESPKTEIPLLDKVNINKADLKILTSLPGIGIKTAEKIIQLRDKKGRFSKIEDLLDVKGIGTKKFEKLKNFITIE